MKKKCNKIFITELILISALIFIPYSSKADGNKLSPEQFLTQIRQNHPADTWGLLKGEIMQRRRGSSLVEYPIRLAIRFTKTRSLAQISIDKDETYTVGQSYNENDASVLKVNNHSNQYKLGELGLRPEDITMSFIYWKFKDELKNDTVKGEACRVFELQNPKTKEKVKIYVSTEYFALLKAEWIKPDGKAPYRTLHVDSFKEVNKLWTYSEFTIDGPGWRTKIDFDNIDLGYVKNGIPKELFLRSAMMKNDKSTLNHEASKPSSFQNMINHFF